MGFFNRDVYVGGHSKRFARTEHREQLRSSPLIWDPYSDPAPLRTLLNSNRELYLEIGFGRGHFLAEVSRRRPQAAFIGLETAFVYNKRFIKMFGDHGLDNVHFMYADSRAVLEDFFPAHRISGAFILFPDPWWKRRHKKKLLVTEDMAKAMTHYLRPDGFITLRTDVTDYFHHMETSFTRHYLPSTESDWYSDILTVREQRCRADNKTIHKIVYSGLRTSSSE